MAGARPVIAATPAPLCGRHEAGPHEVHVFLFGPFPPQREQRHDILGRDIDLSIAVVGSPDYFARHPRPEVPGDLLAHNCIRRRFKSGTVFRWEFEKHGEAITVDVKGTLALDNSRLAIEAACAGHGLTYTSEWAVADDIAAGRLVRVLTDWTPPFAGLCLYYPSHGHVSAGLRALISLTREIMARPRPA